MADDRSFLSFFAVILLESGKRITVDLSKVTVVAAEAAASGGMGPIIKPLLVGAVTAAIPFVPGVGPVVGGLVSWGFNLAPIVVPAALKALRGHNETDAQCPE